MIGGQRSGGARTAADGASGGGGGGGGGVTSVGAGAGISVTGPAGTPTVANTGVNTAAAGDTGLTVAGTTALTIAQNVDARWKSTTTEAAVRFFAVDYDSGNDANAGYSDVSCAAAGAVAIKTLEQLCAILPGLGRGRRCAITICSRAGGAAYLRKDGVTTDSTYFLEGMVGYDRLTVRGTITNATASSVKFADDAADRIMCGMVTATGMNAAGYKPTGAPTTSVIQCLTAAGGAPGFAADGAIPAGARLRFASTTTTAALRNYTAMVSAVAGGDTLTTHSVLPAVPVASDVFYLEMPGVTVASLLYNSGLTSRDIARSIAGFNAASAQFRGSPGRVNACWVSGNLFWEGADTVLFDELWFGASGGASARVGVGVRTTNGMFFTGCQFASISASWNSAAAAVEFLQCVVGQFQGGSVSWGGVLLGSNGTSPSPLNNTIGFPSVIGNDQSIPSASSYNPTRLPGAGPFGVDQAGVAMFSSIQIGALALTGMGANPGISMNGVGLLLAISSAASGSTGNNDVGLSLVRAKGCTVVLTSTPTLTGAIGDIRLADGTIVSWAVAALGLVDSAGNRFIGASTATPTGALPFSGTLSGAGAAAATFLADAGFGGANNATALQRPTSNRMALRLRTFAASNSATGTVTVTLFKNGVATSMAVTYAAGVTGSKVDSAHPVLFSDTDTIDVKVTNAGADAGAVTNLSGLVEYAA